MFYKFLKKLFPSLFGESQSKQNRKLIIVAAPSGAGKTTIVRHLLKTFDFLDFSVSATTREKRAHEEHGKHYYFISVDDFNKKLGKGAFLEWQEVYENQYYGTLKSEIERLWALNKQVIFDIDVKGALNIKKAYPDNSLSVFVKPPSPEILFERLRNRKTESEASLKKRIARATEELTYEHKFDIVLLNDDLETALENAEKIVLAFINS
ncbi:MAG: guanylate kinase [Bacteroidota bacterium]